MNTCGELELELAANQAEPENQAGLVPGPGLDPKKNFNSNFQKIKSGTMPDHRVKGQPSTSTYVQEKGGVKKDSNRETPCTMFKGVLAKARMLTQFLQRNSLISLGYTRLTY